jgi:hypothetical protein
MSRGTASVSGLMDGYDDGNNRDDERNDRDDNRPFRDPSICFGGVWGRAQTRRHCPERRDAVIENVTSASILRFNSLARRVIPILVQELEPNSVRRFPAPWTAQESLCLPGGVSKAKRESERLI